VCVIACTLEPPLNRHTPLSSGINSLLFLLNTHHLSLQLSLKDEDDVTPVTLLHNMVGHLYGPSRPLGAVVCGYSGIRTFEPQVTVSRPYAIDVTISRN